jgi:hypothetical protein
MLAEAFDHSRSQVGELALRTMIAWDYGGEVLRGEECGRTGLRAARAHGQRQTEAALLIRPAMIHHITDRETGRSEDQRAIEIFQTLPPSRSTFRRSASCTARTVSWTA